MNDAERSYRVLQVLGAGGFGKVYCAEMTSFGGVTQQVALKVVRPVASSAAEAERRLRDEARMLGLLRHRAVVKVHGLTRLEPGLTLVMEYVEGVDCQRIVRHDEMPVRVALEVVEEVASALVAAWSTKGSDGSPLRLIHRDLKPANIRLTSDGEVKVLDFGAARAEFAARESSTEQYVVGSMRYMAPERLVGQDSPAVDVYALGLVLAELLTREEPAAQALTRQKQGANVASMVGMVETRLARERVAAPVVRKLLDLLRNAMSFDVDRRPDAAELEATCRDLRASLPGPTLREWAPKVLPWVPPPTVTTRPDEWTGKTLMEQRLPEEQSGVRPAPRPPEPRPARRPPPARPGWVLPAVGVVVVGVALVGIVGLGLGIGVWLGKREEPAPAPVVSAPAPAAPAPPPVETVKTTTVPAKPTRAPRAPRAAEATPAVPTSQVQVGGDARDVVASSGTQQWSLPGAIPAGAYKVKATFADGTTWSGNLALRDGAVVYCLQVYSKCEAR